MKIQKSIISFIALLCCCMFMHAQSPTFRYVFNNSSSNVTAKSIVHDVSSNTYVGGDFTSVGLYSGRGAKIDTSTGNWDTSFAKANGIIRTVVAIPSGGWFIGGEFTQVGGVARNYLARLNADGSLHAFNPNMNDFVLALALDPSGNLFVGGYFTAAGGINRNSLCKYDNTGVLTSFDPNMGHIVYALAIDATGSLYVGGSFSTVGPVGSAVTRNRLCKFDNTGTLTSFDPNMNLLVSCLAIDASNSLYAAGFFTSTNGISRNRLCKFDSTGTLTSTNPPSISGGVNAIALDAAGNIFLGGTFSLVGSGVRNRLLKLNNAGVLLSFDPNMNNPVNALVIDASGNLYVGGAFIFAGVASRNYLCKYNSSGVLQSFNPNMNGQVHALALDGLGNIYAGGAFTTAGSVSRNRLCKFDYTGTLTSFNPNMNGIVNAIATDASGNIYAGGLFSNVGGVARNRLCKFDNNGTLTAFNPDMNGDVNALAVDASNNVYVGGSFTTTGGISRPYLCKFDNVGTLNSFNPIMGSTVHVLKVDASGSLFVGGAFTSAAGTARNRLCKFDNTGVLTSFDPNMNGNVLALALDGASNLYAGGLFSSVGPAGSSVTRNRLCKFNSSGVLQSFAPNMNSQVNALAVDVSGNLYAGGVFSFVITTIRNFLCQFDNLGNLTSFNPITGGVTHALAVDTSGQLHVGALSSNPSLVYTMYSLDPVCPTSFGTLNVGICAGDSYIFNGVALTVANTYLDTLLTMAGCDSVVTLNLSVNPTSSGVINDSFCVGTSFMFNGIARTVAGTYLDTLQNVNSCDSFLTLNLFLKACASSLPAGVDVFCAPYNFSPAVGTSTPYATSDYANINTHSDTLKQHNLFATFQAAEPIGSCGSAGIINKTTWTSFEAPKCATPQIIISTDDRSTTDFDTRVSVYRRIVPSSCTAGYTEIACSDNDVHPSNTGATNNSTILLSPASGVPVSNEYVLGETIYIQTSGVGAASGDYGLIVDVEPYIPISTSIGSGSVVVDWSAASGMGGITGVYIQYRPVGSAPTVAGIWRYVTGTTNTTIVGLTPGVAYEYWASYVCANGGRWWSNKGTFITNTTCTGGVSPSIVSIAAGSPSCNKPEVSFVATAIEYSSYKIARRRLGTSTITYSSTFYPSASTQTWTNGALVLGASYEFWVIGYCGVTSVITSPITTYTVCSVLRQANPDATEQVDADNDVVYVMPNGDMSYGLSLNQLPIILDMQNTGEQEITLQTIDANTYFARDIESAAVEAKIGTISIYPNPASNEASISYSLEQKATSLDLQIIDMHGQEIMKEHILNPELSGMYMINLTQYCSGVYIVKLHTGNFTTTKKLIVNKN